MTRGSHGPGIWLVTGPFPVEAFTRYAVLEGRRKATTSKNDGRSRRRPTRKGRATQARSIDLGLWPPPPQAGVSSNGPEPDSQRVAKRWRACGLGPEMAGGKVRGGADFRVPAPSRSLMRRPLSPQEPRSGPRTPGPDPSGRTQRRQVRRRGPVAPQDPPQESRLPATPLLPSRNAWHPRRARLGPSTRPQRS